MSDQPPMLWPDDEPTTREEALARYQAAVLAAGDDYPAYRQALATNQTDLERILGPNWWRKSRAAP